MSNGIRRRGSIFTGLLLIVIGVIFLLDRFDPAFGLGRLIRIYWPVLIILWGVAKLIDHLAAQRAGEPRAPLLSGGEAALMILLAFVLAGFVSRDWIRNHYLDFNIELPPFHQSYSHTRQLASQTIPADAHVTVDTARGDISVHAADGNELRVGVKESAWAPTASVANEQMRNVDMVIEQAGNVYHVHPVHQDDLRGRVGVDLDIALPKTASIEVNTGHGDIQISGIGGSVGARSANGDVEIRDVGSDVAVDLQEGDAKISGVAGNVKLTGRGNDADLGNISGDVTVEGAYVGSIRANDVAKTLRCISPWSDLTITHLTGRLEADPGDIAISGVNGPVKLAAHNKDIDIKNVSGRIEIVNTHGDVKVSYATPPRDDLIVTNDSGDTDVTLPAASNFGVSAVSRSGEVESDFEAPSLKASNEDDRGQINGKIGATGPMINIATSYGTIHLRKAG